ncbi:MAG: hypothetical protein FJ387_13795 [Verrucomicrobia bacterium]|nr:hypothetical protein [Verrucomicrobiota bacterium]
MNPEPRTSQALNALTVAFLALTLAFLLDLWGRPLALTEIPPVDPQFTNTATVRLSIADQIAAGADPSDWDCYICHDRKKPPQLRFDENQNLLIPEEHEDIQLHHGSHNRNNNCFNCHNENNLDLLQTRDGRELKLAESTPLCGSCHGPTYRDWEAGAHGRANGHWHDSFGPRLRQACVACHDPHAPAFPQQKVGPGPYPLRPVDIPTAHPQPPH